MKEQKLPSATHFSKALIPPTSLKLLLLMLLMGSTLLNAVAYFSVFPSLSGMPVRGPASLRASGSYSFVSVA